MLKSCGALVPVFGGGDVHLLALFVRYSSSFASTKIAKPHQRHHIWVDLFVLPFIPTLKLFLCNGAVSYSVQAASPPRTRRLASLAFSLAFSSSSTCFFTAASNPSGV